VAEGRTDVLTDLAAFEDAIDGDVILPGSSAYGPLRRSAWAQCDEIRPEVVVRCGTPADVAATVALARRTGIEAAARSGGHCFAGRSSTRGILIDVSPMRYVSVTGGVATVGAGALLGDIYERLDARGKAGRGFPGTQGLMSAFPFARACAGN
jgi:FAD/FMN-containing dehydrogenase